MVVNPLESGSSIYFQSLQTLWKHDSSLWFSYFARQHDGGSGGARADMDTNLIWYQFGIRGGAPLYTIQGFFDSCFKRCKAPSPSRPAANVCGGCNQSGLLAVSAGVAAPTSCLIEHPSISAWTASFRIDSRVSRTFKYNSEMRLLEELEERKKPKNGRFVLCRVMVWGAAKKALAAHKRWA